MIQNTKDNFSSIKRDDNIFKDTRLTADSGFHTSKNMDMLAEQEIDGCVADRYFRKRDPAFDNR
jgi:hypothetical protein